MKKGLIIVTLLLVFLTGCGTKSSSNTNSNSQDVTVTKYGNEEGLILQYERYSTTAEREEYTVSVTNAEGKRTILYSLSYFKDGQIHSKSSYKDLSEEEYKKIERIAFSKDFLSLDSDLTEYQTAGGDTSYITVYYNDTSFRTGGQHIDNSLYKELEQLLLSHEDNEE